MQAQSIHNSDFKHFAWLLLAAGVIALATPRAAQAHDNHYGPALIAGAALGYALHDAYGRDRAYFVHDAKRHRGWRDCRARNHFRHARGYRYMERAYYRSYMNDVRGPRGNRGHRGRHHRKDRHHGRGY